MTWSQMFIFFFESTSSTICFAAHEIAINPDIQKRLQNEIDILKRPMAKELTKPSITWNTWIPDQRDS
jgi:cytochrome P450 family 9